MTEKILDEQQRKAMVQYIENNKVITLNHYIGRLTLVLAAGIIDRGIYKDKRYISAKTVRTQNCKKKLALNGTAIIKNSEKSNPYHTDKLKLKQHEQSLEVCFPNQKPEASNANILEIV